MPKPNPTTVPDENTWAGVHRFLRDDHLIPFARNLLDYDGQSLAGHKQQVLSFLNPGSEEEAQSAWSAYWVMIPQTYGLARIYNDVCFPTELARYVISPGSDLATYFRLWALRFQFPWAQNKHREWKDKKKAVQPLVVIANCLELLAMMKDGAQRGASASLTYSDVVRYLMPQERFDADTLQKVCLEITSGAPATPIGTPEDLDALQEQFRTRLCPLFQRSQLLHFDQKSISIETEAERKSVQEWLRFRQPAHVVESEDDRERLFSVGFGRTLVSSTEHLQRALDLAGFHPI